METKHKRGGDDLINILDRPSKRAKKGADKSKDQAVNHVLLSQYYSETETLRAHVLARLPVASRVRRKKISLMGRGPSSPARASCTDEELALGNLLDSTIVATRRVIEPEPEPEPEPGAGKPDHRWEQWVSFSQRGGGEDKSYVTLSDGLRGSVFSQSEIVDFVVWLLFSRHKGAFWPNHLLCDGFRKQGGSFLHQKTGTAGAERTGIPGLSAAYPNQRVKALKESPWPQLLMLLGKAGERIMIDLLVDCAIFQPVKAGEGNLYQLSGVSIIELEPLSSASQPAKGTPKTVELRPSEISFVRSRIMFAKAALNARGSVSFGLRHIHALNRLPHSPEPPKGKDNGPSVESHDENCIRLMMYIFPRQFGLHNVFTSVVDRQQTTQKFQDYTLREDEIAKKFPKKDKDDQPIKHIPKRLRGGPKQLVQRLQILHGRCSYASMLQHYCPIAGRVMVEEETSDSSTNKLPLPQPAPQPNKRAKGRNMSQPAPSSVPPLQYSLLTELATPLTNVSAYCQAILSRIIPNNFWGEGTLQEQNKKTFLKTVNHFVHLRRFESMCLHDVVQGMKIRDLEWLTPPGLAKQSCSQSDLKKRTEIFHEFLYYLFDSILMPLIRSNFYVTESSVHRNRLFFFRHDVWRYVAEPAMAALREAMFEEVRLDDALRILDSRRLGFAQVRLLPKLSDVRPIMNLRRRAVSRGNQKILGPSINTVLNPVSTMLNLEKSLHPKRLGSSMFSVGEIYSRIKAFKAGLGKGEHQFYFAKVDVKAAFDTIPQEAMVKVLRRIPQQSQYKLAKHVEVRPTETAMARGSKGVRASKRWRSTAKATGDTTSFFPDVVEATLGASRSETIFIDSTAHKTHEKRELLDLTATHIEQNIVRIGKKYYRQKCGIPQGSVLSSALCNYFYADLERRHLSFLQEGGGDKEGGDCLLLRLIDDFLLITTDQAKARRFVETMHGGLPRYGVTVSPAKTLVNFRLAVPGGDNGSEMTVARSARGRGFPYCGLAIDCQTLEISKQRDTTKDPVVFNSLTVDYSRRPGHNFSRKVINAFKIQSHLMFFDTSHNTRHAVLANVYTAFVETATKMWAYARCLGSASAVPARSAAGAGAGANGSSSRRPAAAAAMPGTPLLIGK